MAYLKNNSLGRSDAYTMSASIWFWIPDIVQGQLLDSRTITTDVYGFEYDNEPFMIYCLSSASSKLTCQVNQPLEWAQHPVHDFFVIQYNMLSFRQTIIDAVRANGQFYDLTLPPFPKDDGISGGFTLSQVSSMVMRADDGAGHILDIDFSTSIRSNPQGWPPPDGGPSSIPATGIDTYSNVFKTVNVIYEGDFVDASSVARRHFFNTTTNCIVRNGWNHCAMSANNSTHDHLWIINGVNRTGTFVNFDTMFDEFDPQSPYVTSPWVVQFSGAPTFVPSDRSEYPNDQSGGDYGGTHDDYTAVRFSNYQVWTNQYIDWTSAANFAKVVKIVGATGTPASVSAAAVTFGTPAIWLHGDAVHFPTNHGTGGAFTNIGIETDFLPGPSY